jgi:hypothetical protein
MRIFARAVLLAMTVVLVTSCGGGPTAPRPEEAQAIGPHGGVTVALTDSARAEVLLEAPKSAAKSGSVQVVAYFFGTDMRTPLAPPPTDVNVTVAFPDREQTVALDPEARGKGETSRFASKAGPYAVEPLSGTLKATLGGQAVSQTFASAR